MVIVTAATPWESRPLIQAWGLRPSGRSLLHQGSCGGKTLLLLETGIGPVKTQEALATLVDLPDLGLVISSGFAGGLQPGVRSGDMVADLRGSPLETVEAARRTAGALKLVLHLGNIISMDQVVADPKEKLALGQHHRAVAVDMESLSVREWASSRGAPFVSARVVLDALEDRLPKGLPAGDSTAQLARYALRNLVQLPRMVRLAFRQRKAVRSLISFLDGFIKEIG